jgi:hypothetical protein
MLGSVNSSTEPTANRFRLQKTKKNFAKTEKGMRGAFYSAIRERR